jgi:hypothetical protein
MLKKYIKNSTPENVAKFTQERMGIKRVSPVTPTENEYQPARLLCPATSKFSTRECMSIESYQK